VNDVVIVGYYQFYGATLLCFLGQSIVSILSHVLNIRFTVVNILNMFDNYADQVKLSNHLSINHLSIDRLID